jgi:tetratricopeptide (TPR) repeat protein
MENMMVYEDYIDRLMYMDSIHDIHFSLGNTEGLDYRILIKAIKKKEETYIEQGLKAQLELSKFLEEIVEKFVKENLGGGGTSPLISTGEQLIREGLKMENALQVYLLLRKHRRFVNRQFHDSLEAIIHKFPSNSPQFKNWVTLFSVVSLMVDDQVLLVRGYIMWASYCRKIERLDVADRRLTRALEIAQGLEDNELLMMTAAAQASLYDQMNLNAKAIVSYENVLEVALASNNEILVTGINRELAGCYRRAGRYSDALETIDKCIEFSQSLPVPTYEARDRLMKGLILEDLGNYSDGEVEYEKTKKLAETVGDRSLQFEAMTNIAASIMKQNEPMEAVKKNWENLRVIEKWGNPIMIGSTYNNLGHTLLSAKHPADALRAYGKALSLKFHAGAKRSEAISFLGMGDAFKALGDNELAKNSYTLALLPFLESGDESIMLMYASRLLDLEMGIEEDDVATVLMERERAIEKGDIQSELILSSLLAKYYMDTGSEDQAEKLYRKSIARAKDADLSNPQLIQIQVHLAKLLKNKKGNRQEAFDILYNNARQFIEPKLHHEIRDQRRGEIVSEWIDLYGTLIQLLLGHGDEFQVPGEIPPDISAFELHESTKSRSFIASLADMPLQPPQAIPQALNAEEESLLALERTLQDHEGHKHVKSSEYRRKQLRDVNEKLRKCWDKMIPYAPDYVKLRSGKPATFQDFQDTIQLLTKKKGTVTAFLSFFCDKEEITIFVERSDELKLHTFQCAIGSEKLKDATIQLRHTFNGSNEVFPPLPPIRRERPWDRDLTFFEELSGELLKMLPVIEGVELLCVFPHGPLHLLPLHALKMPDGRYLIEKYAVTYCPSISTLNYCVANQTAKSPANKKTSVYVAGIASQQDLRPDFFEQDHQLFNQRYWDVSSDFGAQMASKSQVLKEMGKNDVVHLACHGYFDSINPMNSGLLFSNGSSRPPRNPRAIPLFERNQYLATVKDFLGTRMNTSLVTLRACSSGISGAKNAGDEFAGLSRALLYSGNSSVLVSLWNLDQESSFTFLNRFYHHWKGSQGANEKWRALWMTQKEFINSPNEAFLKHPYHWAPFVLIGDWR